MEKTSEKYLIALYRRKEPFLYLVTAGLKAKTVLGYTWWWLDPSLGMLLRQR